MAAVHGDTGRDDERVRNVQRTGAELLAATFGDGAGWHATKGLRQGDEEKRNTLGSDRGLCDLLGTLPAAGLQEADHTGHHALWCGTDAGVRDAGGAADS